MLRNVQKISFLKPIMTLNRSLKKRLNRVESNESDGKLIKFYGLLWCEMNHKISFIRIRDNKPSLPSYIYLSHLFSSI